VSIETQRIKPLAPKTIGACQVPEDTVEISSDGAAPELITHSLSWGSCLQIELFYPLLPKPGNSDRYIAVPQLKIPRKNSNWILIVALFIIENAPSSNLIYYQTDIQMDAFRGYLTITNRKSTQNSPAIASTLPGLKRVGCHGSITGSDRTAAPDKMHHKITMGCPGLWTSGDVDPGVELGAIPVIGHQGLVDRLSQRLTNPSPDRLLSRPLLKNPILLRFRRLFH
jgi:hypothetical protein